MKFTIDIEGPQRLVHLGGVMILLLGLTCLFLWMMKSLLNENLNLVDRIKLIQIPHLGSGDYKFDLEKTRSSLRHALYVEFCFLHFHILELVYTLCYEHRVSSVDLAVS